MHNQTVKIAEGAFMTNFIYDSFQNDGWQHSRVLTFNYFPSVRFVPWLGKDEEAGMRSF